MLALDAKRMPRCLLACALFVFSALAAAQGAAASAPHNVVELAASGSVEAPQDWLTVTLSITREGRDAGAVQNGLRQALDAALSELKNSGQTGAMEVHSGGFSLQPRYGTDAKISAWVGTAELVLEGSDFARMGAAAARAQPLTISSLRFGLSRQARNQLESQAQAQAIASFKAKASDIARGFGFAEYSLLEIRVGTAEQPQSPAPRMLAMAARAVDADAPIPMEGGKSLVQVTVSGGVQLK